MKATSTAKLTSYHCVATLCDPRFKGTPEQGYMSADSYRTSVATIEMHLKEIATTVYAKSAAVHATIPKKRRYTLNDSYNEDDDDLDDIDVDDPKSRAVKELQKYISSKDLDEDADVMKFWNDSEFVALKQVARSYLAIPATQTATERSFSAAGLTMSQLRTKMDPIHMNELLVIRSSVNTSNNNTV